MKSKEEMLDKYPHVTGTTEGDESRLTIKRKDLFALMTEYATQSPCCARWVKSSDRKPTVTKTYFGKYNGNELCFIYVTGGEVYKMRFTNAAEFSAGFRDMNKIEYEWYNDESPCTCQKEIESRDKEIADHVNKLKELKVLIERYNKMTGETGCGNHVYNDINEHLAKTNNL